MAFDDWATEKVAELVSNVEYLYLDAMRYARTGDLEGLEEYVLAAIKEAPEGSHASYLRQSVAWDDLLRVDWAEVATCVTGE